MSKKKTVPLRKITQPTVSSNDILRGFCDSMESPELPAKHQPQRSYLPPMSKRAKIPSSLRHADIDLTTEPDVASEQPIPTLLCHHLSPPDRPVSSSSSSSHAAPRTALSTKGEMSSVNGILGLISEAKQTYASNTPRTNTHTVNSDLCRAPLKLKRPQSSGNSAPSRPSHPSRTSHPTGKLNQSSSSRGRPRERSFAPSMSSSLPVARQHTGSSASPPNKRSRIGLACGDDTKRMPNNKTTPPRSLLADIYNSVDSEKSPTSRNVSSGRGGHSTAGNNVGKGRQKNTSADKPVVIDLDDGEQNVHGDLRPQPKPTESSRIQRDLPKQSLATRSVEVVEERVSCGIIGSPVQIFEQANRSEEGQRSSEAVSSPLNDEERIPSLLVLKTQAQAASQAHRRTLGSDCQDVTKSVAISSQSADSAVVGGGVADGRDDQCSPVRHHTVASSSAESDDSVLYMETTSKHFSSEESRRGSEVAIEKSDVRAGSATSVSPPEDILTKINSHQHDRKCAGSTPSNFVPRCKGRSPDDTSKSTDLSQQQTPKHHLNRFAKNLPLKRRESVDNSPPSTEEADVFGGPGSTEARKTKMTPRFSEETLNFTPTLSKSSFSLDFTAKEEERTAANKAGRKSSQSSEHNEVIFQSESTNKKYPFRDRSKHVRISESSNHSEGEDDFQKTSSTKTAAPVKKNTTQFYGSSTAVGSPFTQLLKMAEANALANKAKLAKGQVSKQKKKKLVSDVIKKLVSDVIKQPVRKIPRKRSRWQDIHSAQDEDLSFELNRVQVGRLLSDRAYNLDIRNDELSFPFDCGGKTHNTIIQLKTLTEWKMNLGEPKFIAIKINDGAILKQKSLFTNKFPLLRDDFFQLGSSNPSEHYIVFHLRGNISPETIANIYERLDYLKDLSSVGCEIDIVKDMSPQDTKGFLDSVKPTKPAMKSDHLSKEDPTAVSEVSLSSDDVKVADVTTGQNRVRRSTRARRQRCPTINSVDGSDSEEPVSRPRGPNVKLFTYKPVGSKMTLDIMSADVECLDPGEYLNDKIIDFYLNYLLYEKLSETVRGKVHIFSTFFYTRLSNASLDDKAASCTTPEKLHSRVKTWTRRVDLFDKDYIILPVCDRAHWYVVIVCHPGMYDPAKVLPRQPIRKPTKGRSRRSLKLRRRKTGKAAAIVSDDDDDKEEESKKEEGPLEMEVEEGWREDSLAKEDVTGDMDTIEGKEMTEEDIEADLENTSIFSCLPAVAEVAPTISDGNMEGGVSMQGTSVPETPPLSPDGNVYLDKDEGEPPPLSSLSGHSPMDLDDCAVAKEERESVVSDEEDGHSAESANQTIPETISDGEMEEGTTGPTSLGEKAAQEEDGVDIESGYEDNSVEEEGSLGAAKVNEDNSVEEGGSLGAAKVKQEMEEKNKEDLKLPCIQILDSLGIRRPGTARRMRSYLTMEWKLKKADKEGELSFEHLPLKYPRTPLQDNSSDCGIFVLQFVESLLETVHKGVPPPSEADAWASYNQTRAKRKEISELIGELKER